MDNYADSKKLQALRELLEPKVVAAWLDEVDQYRGRGPGKPAADSIASATQREWPERLLTVSELTERLRVGRSWLYERSRRAGFPVIRLGRSLRFRQSEVEEWLAANGSEADGVGLQEAR